MTLTTETVAAPDFVAIKHKQQATWSSGDYCVVGTTLQIVGEQLAEAANVRAGERVLDVAAGNGNATLAAARRFADVISTDYAPNLLERGRERAQAERLPVRFEVADAEALPFADASFDTVLSTFGVMFAPDQERAAAELLRVTRPGGRIGMANWTPESFIGQLFKLISRHLPPPAGLRSPVLWGSTAWLHETFDDAAGQFTIERRHFNFRYRSAAHFVQVFRDFYGPTHKAFAALPDARGEALERELLALLGQFNVAAPHSLVVPSEYVEVVITKRA